MSMGKSLEEYAAQHPQLEPERERETVAAAARSFRDQKEERELIAQLKASITQQLQAGSAPELILYTALRAIGILSHDEEWAEAGRQQLDSIYSDLAQESLLTDNAAVAAQRLEDLRGKYNDRLRRQLTSQLNGYRKVEKALLDALSAVNQTESKT